MGPMLAAKGERLTGWATRDQVNVPSVIRVFHIPNVRCDQRPLSNVERSGPFVLSYTVAGIGITLYDGRVPKTRRGNP